MNNFFKTLFNIAFDVRRARELRNDPERKDKSKRFGILAIILSIIAIPFSLLMFIAANVLASGGGIITILIVLVLGVLGIALPIILLLDSLFYMILQLSINKKAISWISLAVVLISIIAVGVIAFLAFSGMNA